MDNITSAEYISDILKVSNRIGFNDYTIEALCKARYETMCKNSPIGLYKCSIKINLTNQKQISCDTCLQAELIDLIKTKGIETIGSCCGHGVNQGYIQVAETDVKKMIDLGYEEIPVDNNENGKWCFKPKTVLYIETEKTDVEEVRHGKWIIQNEERDWQDKNRYKLFIKCNKCGFSHFLGTTNYKNEVDDEKLKKLVSSLNFFFCGCCGARMDGDEK